MREIKYTTYIMYFCVFVPDVDSSGDESLARKLLIISHLKRTFTEG